MRRTALVLALAFVAAPTFAQEWRTHPHPTPTPTPTPRWGPPPRRTPTPPPIPPAVVTCQPGLAPGTLCTWPSTAYSLPLAATGQPDLPAIGRMVAIIEGPLLVPMDPRAIRITQSISLSESWWICETSEPAGSYAVMLTSDAWCGVQP